LASKAFFVDCDGHQDQLPHSRNKFISSGSLQEALAKRRPDYIANTRHRESHRLAKRAIAADKAAIIENVPCGHSGYSGRFGHSDQIQSGRIGHSGQQKLKKTIKNVANHAEEAERDSLDVHVRLKGALKPRKVDRSKATETSLTTSSSNSNSNRLKRTSMNSGGKYHSPYSQKLATPPTTTEKKRSSINRRSTDSSSTSTNETNERKKERSYRTNRTMASLSGRGTTLGATDR